MHYEIDDFTDPWREAETILMIHGNAERGQAWYGWVPTLAREFRIVRPDTRGFGESTARSSIATLVYALARRKDLPQYKATLRYLTGRLDQQAQGWPEYARYYQAQALFQGDPAAWEKWNKLLVRQLKEAQLPDGSIRGQFGSTISTSLSLLSLALNYRFLPIYER